MLELNRRQFLASAALAATARPAQASARDLPFRQVHLDFHTSELITDVAADFDANEFARTLRDARVNSVNVFAKCHHGWAYYDTAIAARHPALKIDLLGEMIRACRANGIKVLYYYSLVWDVRQARLHPEWRVLTKDGKVVGGQPGDAWPWLCMNSPYLDQVVAENSEIVARYEVDGAWFDILKQPPAGCFCRWCIAERAKLGFSDDGSGVARHNKIVAKRVEDRLNRVVHARFPNGLTFYNSRLVVGVRDELDYYSHIEIESLPSGGWGYAHFQQRVRYMRTLGKEMVGMTGRFHKSWGDFGGLKNQAALDFECLNFVANGARCCVGDQLAPRGRLEPETYKLIGNTYRRIEALEPWARGAVALADIGVLSTAAGDTETAKLTPSDQGFTNLLVESHQQFDVLDAAAGFTRYRLLILPDKIEPGAELVDQLRSYLRQGGALIASHESLLDLAAERFALDELGVRYLGPARHRQEYLVPRTGKLPSLPQTGLFLYQPGSSVEARPGAEVLATYGHPYFDRSPETFSSHKQTPLARVTGEPVVTINGRCAYIANPIFRAYSMDGYGVYRRLVEDLIARLLPDPLLRVPGLPSTAQATLLQLPDSTRVVHLLHYPAARRAPDLDIIEEAGILVDQLVEVKAPAAVKSVRLVPDGSPVSFTVRGGYVRFRLSKVAGHQAIAIG